ncbi:glycerate kinase [Marinithermofilum abyssi]|uniref:Glycerate kinase n=1 Tax=Marinithermofilum abyssi TaxID=1571185 RepID=A0A8J2VET8_9BACL|nr:glycerate kinase [Marinithermofilum abyssi]GGE13868.1 glycerate kinase [Marinithermofilum abyssi]
MNVVIAPDSFKGSMMSLEASEAMKRGIRNVFPQAKIETLPMADGGEGTVDAILAMIGGEKIRVTVKDPLNRDIVACFGFCPERKLAVIETAAASGLPLLQPEERNPCRTSTYGTGELLKAALDRGAEQVILGLGGSATVDAGTGFFAALGTSFRDHEGNEWIPSGGDLGKVVEIDLAGLDERLKNVSITVASDVTNPLLGPEGAVRVFGPQKGIQEKDLDAFEEEMARYAEQVVRITGKDYRNTPGSGAAGGFGFSLLSLLDVTMKSGFALIAELGDMESRIRSADLVLTGEGRMDRQSLYGKVPVGIARIAKRAGVPVIAFCGSVEAELVEAEEVGIALIQPIVDEPMSLEEAMERGPELLEAAVKRVGRGMRIVP